ncbi:zinc finger protein 622 [Venturia canescens]|uniref:zinc finger protein 622 n=1 Tax=Venturia canescens TaxID=32260 RepID=UPI001C9CFDCE|nr:zinc finger protein 622 [Venturia canescens]XP_043283666.1 zinc finger protein 622 [Venturia canescens]XP_043283667.1 zinc finger protein 622 [Venturia canescens]XP_043283668.1 zinc finger protein 622 [Venturia canescens]XP_043283669.1 zinc finger protein 622 [Venturia canescens]
MMAANPNGVSILPYSCITCRVAFRDLEIQRQHYKSDWHRYNLKRKVAELPPVSVEEFQKRVIAQRGREDKLREDKTSSRCKPCRKNFGTKTQLENHILSRKHKERVLKNEIEEEERRNGEEDQPMRENLPESTKPQNSMMKIQSEGTNKIKRKDDEMELDSDVETVDSDEWNENPAENNDCLFCNNHSRSFLRNLKHMTLAHSFFIPDPEYCVDPKGLLIYLGEKIFSGYMCIWCNETGKAFQSSDAARAHMLDKGHCKMRHEGESLVEYAEFYNYSTSYPDAGEVDPDTDIEIPEIEDNDYQLVLPSGNVIGHRSLMRYYKQSLDPNRPLAVAKSEKLRKVLCQYRALGWSTTEKAAVEKKARDISYMQRVQAKYSTKLQFKANKFQHHFRPQVNF